MASINEDVPMSDELEYEDDDVEAELEVDELDPSDEETNQPSASAPISPTKKPPARKPGQRTPGHSLFPGVRVENILQSNGTTAGNLAMSKEGQFMLSVATEEFVKQLAKFAYDEAQHAKSNLVRYEDIALVPVVYQPEFSFLQEIIPRPIAIKYAMEFRERRLKELEEEDPALGGFIPPSYTAPTPLFAPSASAPPTTKSSKSKKAATNGKQANGTKDGAAAPKPKKEKAASAKASRSASVSSKSESVGKRRSSRNGSNAASARQAPQPSPLVNGHIAEPADAEMVDGSGENSPWSSQPIGALLQGPGALFERSESSASSNPGRTIYSQNGQPD